MYMNKVARTQKLDEGLNKLIVHVLITIFPIFFFFYFRKKHFPHSSTSITTVKNECFYNFRMEKKILVAMFIIINVTT